MPRIREMRASDAAAVAELVKQLGYHAIEEEVKKRFVVLSTRVDNVLLIAESDIGEAVGFLHAREDLAIHEKQTVEIAALVVLENVRSTGIGRALMLEAERWAYRNGPCDIWLRSNIVREKAHEFYRRMGYEAKKTSHWFIKQRSTRPVD